MKVKHLTLAVAVLAGASAATLFLKRGDESIPLDPREGQPLVEAALIEKIAGVHLHTLTGDIDIVRAADGAAGKWIVPSYYDLPADFTKLSGLVQNLRDAKITRFASAQAERLAKMEFDGTHIELRDADGKALRILHFGRTVDSGGRFIKFDDETKAYVASLTVNPDAIAKNWADAALLPAKPEEITGVEVSFPDGDTLQLKRDNGTAPWTAATLAEGEKLKESEVSSLVSKFTGLRFTETAAPDAEDVVAARANARNFKVTLATGKVFTIALGRKPAPPAPPAVEKTADEGTDAAATPAPPVPQAGPVYVFVQSSDANDPFNEVMKRRGFQIYEWTFTSLPANRAAMVEAVPPTAPVPAGPETVPVAP